MIVKAGVDIEPLETGLQYARCVSRIDLGTQPPTNPTYKPSKQVLLEWEIPSQTYEKDGKVLPRKITRTFGATIGTKATLRAFLESWRGRPFTREELKGFDLNSILDKPCAINIIHHPSGDKVYANIASISPLPKGATMPERTHDLVKFDLSDGRDSAVFKALPEWLQGKILQCLEWNADTTSQPAPHTNGGPEEMVGATDDEVPF
jgi:hypothetical protein